ncbi:MAG: glycerol-3-phosphate 1-O-acyltransferase PlsY [Rhodospirillaceae bacterium]|nr:glycerol-3-phosphate 1-O-acyltransferase PlsY [Rhodospirillaceae bacterium]
MATLHIAAGIVGYLVGSIPFGLVFAKLFGLGDLRKIGSGNIGATNVLRTGNKLAAFLTLIFDIGKGGMVALTVGYFIPNIYAELAAGFWAVMGHNFPVWLNFRGGKGVATAIGVLLATAWPVGLAVIATWLVVAAITRYSSLAALVALAAAPLFSYLLAPPQHIILSGLLAVLVCARHHENARRLLNGTETKIGKKGE